MPQDILIRCLRGVPQVRNDNLIVASETYDDAGVYKLDDETAWSLGINFRQLL